MGEPLKDKKVSLGLYLDAVVNPLKQNVYIEKDLKSAVEYFKNKLKKLVLVHYEDGSPLVLTIKGKEQKDFVEKKKVEELINQSFPDLK